MTVPAERIGNPKAFFAPPPWPHASAGGHPSPAALAAPPARRRSPPERPAARLWLVLDMRLRMGEGSASGVPWGGGLGTGGFGKLGGLGGACATVILCSDLIGTLASSPRYSIWITC